MEKMALRAGTLKLQGLRSTLVKEARIFGIQ